MNPEERQRAYLAALEVLSQQYGWAIAAQVGSRQVGPQLQIEAQLIVVPLEGWQPSIAMPPDVVPPEPGKE